MARKRDHGFDFDAWVDDIERVIDDILRSLPPALSSKLDKCPESFLVL